MYTNTTPQHTKAFQRSGPTAVVIGLHVLFVYALSVGMGWVKTPFVAKEMTVVNVQDDQQQEETKPVLEKPQIVNEVAPQPEVTIPPVEIDVPAEPAETAIAAEPAAPTGGATQALHATSRIDPIYPASERRDGHEGVVRLQVQVDASGRVLDVAVGQSSGFPALDRAAIDAVRRWRFSPKMENGQPMGTVGQVAVTFQLK